MKLPPSSFGCPLDSLLRILAGPWTIYILCRLHTNGETRFGQLKRQMPGISSKMLTERLRSLEKVEIIFRHQAPTIPLQVTYGLTTEGRELTNILDQINTLADRWQDEETKTANSSVQVQVTKRRKGGSNDSVMPPLKEGRTTRKN
ncbi:MAG: hypothetical protein NPIRA06_13660 [Nitrospirales bacterium]|nr:MAG: hypothetical protein NPIRA06_13660 [Nitrospirales bacterium]